jgi:LysR family transcriptional activator of glutamate synthase operon
MSRMELRQLRYLDAVARHGHFTRAAQELHVAQSALSHQIRALERELDLVLFDRTTRSVQITDAGEAVAARARAVLAELDALHGDVDHLRGLIRGHISVGAMLFGGELDIPAVLADFTARYPGVELSLREGTAQTQLQLLQDGVLDLAFSLESEPAEGVERRELSSEELVVATGPADPLPGDGPVPISVLDGRSLIAFERGSSTRAVVDAALARVGAQPRITLETIDFSLMRALVARDVGMAVLPRSYLERHGPEIVFRTLSPPLALTVVLWWRSGRTLSPAATAFIEFAVGHRG